MYQVVINFVELPLRQLFFLFNIKFSDKKEVRILVDLLFVQKLKLDLVRNIQIKSSKCILLIR